MARKTVITKVLPVNTSDAIIEFPQNRTLIVEQLTSEPPAKAEIVKDCRSMGDVFEYYKPKVNVEFEDMDGQPKKEDLDFKELKDFEAKNIVKNSSFLNDLDSKKGIYNDIDKQLRKNKVLRDALANPDSRQALITAMQSMLKELQTKK
jgi:hypothetical protein